MSWKCKNIEWIERYVNVSCTKPFLVHSCSDTCDAISIYKYISTQLGDKTQVDHRGVNLNHFYLWRGHLLLIKWNMNIVVKNYLSHFLNQSTKDYFFFELKKNLFKKLYIDYTFHDFSFQLIYLSSSLLFFIGFT